MERGNGSILDQRSVLVEDTTVDHTGTKFNMTTVLDFAGSSTRCDCAHRDNVSNIEGSIQSDRNVQGDLSHVHEYVVGHWSSIQVELCADVEVRGSASRRVDDRTGRGNVAKLERLLVKVPVRLRGTLGLHTGRYFGVGAQNEFSCRNENATFAPACICRNRSYSSRFFVELECTDGGGGSGRSSFTQASAEGRSKHVRSESNDACYGIAKRWRVDFPISPVECEQEGSYA